MAAIQTVLQDAIDRAKAEVDTSTLNWYSVTDRLTEANGFKVKGGVGGVLILVDPHFDPDNIVDPNAHEWLIQFHEWDGGFLQAPDLFFIWWLDPAELKRLHDEGHVAAHHAEWDARRAEEERAYFAGLVGKG